MKFQRIAQNRGAAGKGGKKRVKGGKIGEFFPKRTGRPALGND